MAKAEFEKNKIQGKLAPKFVASDLTV